jgi:hypothetical protein
MDLCLLASVSVRFVSQVLAVALAALWPRCLPLAAAAFQPFTPQSRFAMGDQNWLLVRPDYR